MSGFYSVQVPAIALLGDDIVPHSAAVIDVTTSVGEFDTIELILTRPDIPEGGKSANVGVDADGAQQLIDALAAAAAGRVEVMIPATSSYDCSRATVEVVAEPAEFEGVFLAFIEHEVGVKATALLNDEQHAELIEVLGVALAVFQGAPAPG